MPYKFSFLLLLLSISCLSVHASFNFNARCIEAYKDIFSLKLNEARALIREEKQQNPQNGITILLDNYVDYFTLLASDSKSDYDKLIGNRSIRLDALDNLEENSPYYLFAKSEIYLQWGLLKAKFGDYFACVRDIKKAKSLLKDNATKYPDFLPNQKNLALTDVVLGAIPSSLKGIAKFFGMSGNTQAGISQLEKLRLMLPNTKYSFYNDEMVFFLCYMNVDVLHNKNEYTKLMSYLATMDNKSLLKIYLEGYVAAKSFHNDEAINYLQAMPRSNEYATLPLANYWLGNAKLCRMDTDANVYLLRYINEYKGMNYIKDAYLKLAYYYLLNNDQAKYAYYVKMVHAKGYTVDEKDKQALKEADDVQSDISLLKARFFYDGGYSNKALDQLKIHQEKDFKLLRDKIEFNYRLGRVYEKLEKYNEAIAGYQRAIVLGKATTYYYSANAALAIGEIFEHKKDYKKAAEYYNQAIDMKNHEYQSSIETQAKDGLERIKQE